MAVASTLLRAARKSRGLTQRALAEAVAFDQGRVSRLEKGREAEFGTVDRVLGATGHRLYSAPTRRDDVASIAGAIHDHLRSGDKHSAFRELIQLNDNLASEHGLIRGILGLAEPEPTGDQAWDSALAALVAMRLAEEGLPLPDWVNSPFRHLARPRTLDVDAADPVPTRDDVPGEFYERGVLIWADSLASV
ncbi:helix-turn-helix domain-containing protein [Microbacterium hydrocarbonoxydans]|uniref:helix-turn-helix domain-containing protein n=1 Tax=Microbacterium hydrocarbonoxydans TaxID=273678 RepID=UPI00203A8DD2|nr:helix-turn-helix domain-containing protein [Microbacterium hydrocarbonoxydans]MCM3780526.1 helix-turn-helix domain-containing protein [Microbacterium hydrocarbonoxydans]